MAGLAPVGSSTIVGYKPALHGTFAYVGERGKEKVEEWALKQEPASKEARKKWRSGLSSKSQPLHGGASGEAPVWR